MVAHEFQCRFMPWVAWVVAGGAVGHEGGCIGVQYLIVQRCPADGVVVELVPSVRAGNLVGGHLSGGPPLAECEHRDLLG